MLINYVQICENIANKRLPSSAYFRIVRKALPRRINRYLSIQKYPSEVLPIKKYVIYVSTNRGTKQDNEDSFCIFNVDKSFISSQSAHESYEVNIDINDSEYLLLAVADGISSLPQSQKTSALVIQNLINNYPTITLENGKYIKRGLQGINRSISKATQRESGSTLAMVLLKHKQVFCANIGDSAIYHLHKGDLRKISVDDTLAREMMDEGLHSNQINDNLFHTLTQYIGQEKTVDPHLLNMEIEYGDILIIMSDAFEPDEKTILEIVGQKGNAAEKLIRNFKDTRPDYYMDNSTVIIALMK